MRVAPAAGQRAALPKAAEMSSRAEAAVSGPQGLSCPLRVPQRWGEGGAPLAQDVLVAGGTWDEAACRVQDEDLGLLAGDVAATWRR